MHLTQINSIWEITHFCKIFQGAEFKTHEDSRILLRHFNSGKIMAISKPQMLLYLQDFFETAKADASSPSPPKTKEATGMSESQDRSRSKFAIFMKPQVLEAAEEVSVGAGLSGPSSARSSNSSSRSSEDSNYIMGGLEMIDMEKAEMDERLRQERERKLHELGEEQLEPKSNAVSSKGGLRTGKPSQDPHSRKNSIGSSNNPISQRQFSNKHSPHRQSTLLSSDNNIVSHSRGKVDSHFEAHPSQSEASAEGNLEFADQSEERDKRPPNEPIYRGAIPNNHSLKSLDHIERNSNNTSNRPSNDHFNNVSATKSNLRMIAAESQKPAVKLPSQQLIRTPQDRQLNDLDPQPDIPLEAERRRRILSSSIKKTFKIEPKISFAKQLLPHKEALKDRKNTVFFTHFQKTTTDYLADGQTFKINRKEETFDRAALKEVNKFLQLDCIDAYFKYQDLYDRFDGIRDNAQHLAHFIKQYHPLSVEYVQADFQSIGFLEEKSKFGLTIELVSETEKRSLLKMRSCIEPLKKLANYYKYNSSERTLIPMLVQIQKILPLIICFLYDATYEKGADYSKMRFSSEPVRERQAVMKELGVIDILMDLIYFPFRNSRHDIETIQKPLYISTVLRLSYTAIKVIIREYRPNELYASQWLDMMIDFALSDSRDKLSSKDTLTELIDNNEKILHSQITDTIIKKFIEHLAVSNDEKSVSILRAMCICNGKPVNKNQRKIIDRLTEATSNERSKLETFLLPLKKVDTNVLLICPAKRSSEGDLVIYQLLRDTDDAGRDAEESNRSRHKSEKRLPFYINLIYLLGDLCYGRNRHAIGIVQGLFGLEAVSELICSDPKEEKGSEVRNAIFYLFEHAYLHVFPFEDKTIPCSIRILQESPEKLELSTPANGEVNNERFKKIIEFIEMFLKHEYQMKYSLEDFDMITSVISLCEKFIRLGFFRSFEQFSVIYQGVTNLLTHIKQVASRYSRSSDSLRFKSAEQNPQSFVAASEDPKEQINKVKVAICSLLKLVLQVETDFFITKAVAVFKRECLSDPNLRNSLSIESFGSKTFSETSKLSGSQSDRTEKILQTILSDAVHSEQRLVKRNSELREVLVNNTLEGDNDLKKISLELIRTLYSQLKSVVSHLKTVLLVDEGKDRQIMQEVSEFQRSLFKNFEIIGSWFNRTEVNGYDMFDVILKQIEDGMKDSSFDIMKPPNMIDEKNLQGKLQTLTSKYFFFELLVCTSLKEQISFFQKMLVSTGTFSYLLKILDFMIEKLPEMPRNATEDNRKCINHLVSLIVKCIIGGSDHKQQVSDFILRWIKAIPLLNHLGLPAVVSSPKKHFSSKSYSMPTVAEGSKERSVPLNEKHLSPIKRREPERSNNSFHFCGNLISAVLFSLYNNKTVSTNAEQVKHIVLAILHNLSASSRQNADMYLMTEYLNCLEQLIFINKVPISENQSLILKLFVEHSKSGILSTVQASTLRSSFKSDLCSEAFTEESMTLTSSSSAPATLMITSPNLCFDLSFLELLALCSYGKNEYAEKISQSLISVK